MCNTIIIIHFSNVTHFLLQVHLLISSSLTLLASMVIVVHNSTLPIRHLLDQTKTSHNSSNSNSHHKHKHLILSHQHRSIKQHHSHNRHKDNNSKDNNNNQRLNKLNNNHPLAVLLIRRRVSRRLPNLLPLSSRKHQVIITTRVLSQCHHSNRLSTQDTTISQFHLVDNRSIILIKGVEEVCRDLVVPDLWHNRWDQHPVKVRWRRLHPYQEIRYPLDKVFHLRVINHITKDSFETKQQCGISNSPANTGHSPTVVSMLDQRRRRWTSIEIALGIFPVFAEMNLLNLCLSSGLWPRDIDPLLVKHWTDRQTDRQICLIDPAKCQYLVFDVI